MNHVRYYYANEANQPVGPFTPEELSRMCEAGILAADTLICEEGGTLWSNLGSHFAPTIAPPRVPSPAPPSHDDLGLPPAKAEMNAGTMAAAAILFPAIAVFFTLAVAANLPFYAMLRALGNGPLVFVLFFAISVFGPINAFKLLRVPGIYGRKPAAVVASSVGIGLFVVTVVVIVLSAFSIEARFAR